ncbi:MAG: ABC transporter ATP-binding protein [Arcobacter sp.]|jgi:branched-chain amino acid transport system ATP-binding protein|uniref:ABC transporter ATP-binding protein n=1 Tax=unclassified Arcobacter TaxID=2593671 RepID=UPI0002296107|nr:MULTISPECIES: ABC transporter ATP-binding protein [unclassified Arcobacter]MDY3200825.1 ABC transporter ATP-binding protein [Arcobacter sp.]BAK72916.1 branched-chain amino acid ABC transporter ATP-binding component [Arcobacter sp. L]
MALLECKNISINYEQIRAVKDVSLVLEEGETITLIGANGAGKSSILKAITGLKGLNSGEIIFNGERIDGKLPSTIVEKGIAMTPEGRRVFPYMSVKDNLLMGAFTRKDKDGIEEDLEKILTKFPRLKERYKQQASTMSGGEQQMMVIGRALMSRPKVLLMDEPSLGIAPKLVQDIARSIVQINQEDKISVILVEQNSRMALKISQRAYAMQLGEVLLSGKSKDLIHDERIIELYLGGSH